jgi:UDP-N-acetylmuramate dehydrogenase
MTEAGEVKTLTPAEVGYGYRHSALPPDWVFLGATYRLVPGEKEHIRTEMRRINAERRQSQPLKMPSSGSWFKNPIVEGEKLSAWRVVEAAGCRGKRVGQAQVSEQHCNFFVNRGGATSHELEELSRQVEAAILETQGIRMEREVRFIGVP